MTTGGRHQQEEQRLPPPCSPALCDAPGGTRPGSPTITISSIAVNDTRSDRRNASVVDAVQTGCSGFRADDAAMPTGPYRGVKPYAENSSAAESEESQSRKALAAAGCGASFRTAAG